MRLTIETQAQRGQKPRQNGTFLAVLVLDETANLGVVDLRRREEKEEGKRKEEGGKKRSEEEEKEDEGE